ncbi:hypothetical protein ONE63_003505 [Megalurothrips usitatus]|uniref:DDE Tnp4 domain-containing protein n=1 Tax=Megalurothrips usitatus TaxID=439358 RepID=A0AAV7X5Q9_9NEOP|nr:hypothetical protein ONE63_003505 [Megalurothrips usitatus]
MGDPCFALHFRMTTTVFEVNEKSVFWFQNLVQAVGAHLTATDQIKRQSRYQLKDVLLMVVWLLATPDSFRSVALRFGVRPGTLYRFYIRIIGALREMAETFITWPDAGERNAIKHRFQRATQFPGVVGCIDGTHVYITAPLEHPGQYRNRHHSYSINVQAVVDNRLLVRDIHVGEAGSLHDRRVFRRSSLYSNLLDGVLPLLSADEHLVGDSAYHLTDFMLTPFENTGHLSPLQINYNKKLSQCRVRVENAFAKAKGKWRRLKFLHAVNSSNIVDHIMASFVLHNFIILYGEPIFQDEDLAVPIQDHEVLGNNQCGDEFDERDEEEHPNLEAAKARGVEKIDFFENHVLPLPDPEV